MRLESIGCLLILVLGCKARNPDEAGLFSGGGTDVVAEEDSSELVKTVAPEKTFKFRCSVSAEDMGAGVEGGQTGKYFFDVAAWNADPDGLRPVKFDLLRGAEKAVLIKEEISQARIEEKGLVVLSFENAEYKMGLTLNYVAGQKEPYTGLFSLQDKKDEKAPELNAVAIACIVDE